VVAVEFNTKREASWKIKSANGKSRFVSDLPNAYLADARDLAIALLAEVIQPEEESDSDY